MARVITCGFETGRVSELVAAQGITTRTATQTNGADVTTSKAINGNYSLACLSTQMVSINVRTYTKPATIYHKFDFLYIPVSGHTRRRLWWDADGVASAHASIFMNDSGQLVYTGDSDNIGHDASILGTGIHTLNPDQWYEINITYSGGSVAGGRLIVDIDGVNDISLINIDTNASAAAIARWRFGDDNSGNDFYFDNIFVNDRITEQDASARNTDNINSQPIPYGNALQFLLPNAEGSSLEWAVTPVSSGLIHYLHLNQIPVELSTPQLTTTRINTSGATNVDMVGIQELPSTSGIRQIHLFTTNAHQSTARHRRMVRTNSTNYTSQFDSNSVTNSLNIRSDIWSANPSNSGAWQKEDIDSLQIGVGVSVQAGTSLNIVGDMNLYVEHYIRPSGSVNLFTEGYIPPTGQIFISNVDSILMAEMDGSSPSIIIEDGDNGLPINGTAYIDIDTQNDKLLFMILGFPSKCYMSDLDGTSLENVPLALTSESTLMPSIAVDNSSTIVTSSNGGIITGPRVFVADYARRRIAVGNIVRKLDLTTGDFIPSIIFYDFIPTDTYPSVVKYDDINQILFWIESDTTLHKMLDGDDSSEVIVAGTDQSSLAIDPIREKVYYSVVQGIIEIDYDGGNFGFISTKDDENHFGGLGLDTNLQNLYSVILTQNEVYLQDVTAINSSSVILSQDDGVNDPRDVKVYLFEDPEIQSVSRQKAFFVNGHIVSGITPIHSIDTPPPQPGTPDGPPLPSGTPPPDDEDVPAPTSLSLFLSAPEGIEADINFFVGSIVIEDYISLYVHAPEGITSYRNFNTLGHTVFNDSVNLYVSHAEEVNDDTDLFTLGLDVESDSINTFIRGANLVSISTTVSGINEFVKTADFNPQILASFTTDVSFVMIEVWSSDNMTLTLDDNICYRVGDTDTWGWSSISLPKQTKFVNQYVFKMTADNMETVVGEFTLKTSESKTIDHGGWNRRNRFIV